MLKGWGEGVGQQEGVRHFLPQAGCMTPSRPAEAPPVHPHIKKENGFFLAPKLLMLQNGSSNPYTLGSKLGGILVTASLLVTMIAPMLDIKPLERVPASTAG